jgi:hypothetical protein
MVLGQTPLVKAVHFQYDQVAELLMRFISKSSNLSLGKFCLRYQIFPIVSLVIIVRSNDYQTCPSGGSLQVRFWKIFGLTSFFK